MADQMECADVRRAITDSLLGFAGERWSEARGQMISNAVAVTLREIRRDGDIFVMPGPDGDHQIMVAVKVKLRNGGTMDVYSFMNPAGRDRNSCG